MSDQAIRREFLKQKIIPWSESYLFHGTPPSGLACILKNGLYCAGSHDLDFCLLSTSNNDNVLTMFSDEPDQGATGLVFSPKFKRVLVLDDFWFDALYGMSGTGAADMWDDHVEAHPKDGERAQKMGLWDGSEFKYESGRFLETFLPKDVEALMFPSFREDRGGRSESEMAVTEAGMKVLEQSIEYIYIRGKEFDNAETARNALADAGIKCEAENPSVDGYWYRLESKGNIQRILRNGGLSSYLPGDGPGGYVDHPEADRWPDQEEEEDQTARLYFSSSPWPTTADRVRLRVPRSAIDLEGPDSLTDYYADTGPHREVLVDVANIEMQTKGRWVKMSSLREVDFKNWTSRYYKRPGYYGNLRGENPPKRLRLFHGTTTKTLIRLRSQMLAELKQSGFYYKGKLRHDATIWDLNNGYCEDFAERAQRLIPGSEVRATDFESDEPAHVWLFVGGRHYDAECVEGVTDYRRLPIIRSKGKSPRPFSAPCTEMAEELAAAKRTGLPATLAVTRPIKAAQFKATRPTHANPSNVIVHRDVKDGRLHIFVNRMAIGEAKVTPQGVVLPKVLSADERAQALRQIKQMGLNPSTFWGRAGAGVLFHCVADDTYLLTLRSSDVEQPGTWGVPGGACGADGFHKDSEGRAIPTAVALTCALREAKEELGWITGMFAEREAIVFQQGNFHYTTFILDISEIEKARMDDARELNWENDDARWFTLKEIKALGDDLHFGVQYVLAHMQRTR